MKAVIDIVLLIIIALCTWNGYKRGLVGGIAAILAIIIALFGGSLLSSAYAHEVVPALKPFVDGHIDSQKTRTKILKNIGYGNTDLSLDDILKQDTSLRYDYAYECFVEVGVFDRHADVLAERSVRYAEENGLDMTQAVVAVMCDTATYVAALTIAFLLILIMLVAIGNVTNLSFRLPNMENLDEVGGAVLGFAKGFLYCILLSWILSFLGAIIGAETMEKTTLGRFFLMFDFLTGSLL